MWIITGEQSISPNLSQLIEKENLTFSGSLGLRDENGSRFSDTYHLHEGAITYVDDGYATIINPNGEEVDGTWVFTSNKKTTTTFEFNPIAVTGLTQAPSTTNYANRYQILGNISVTFIPTNKAHYNEYTTTITNQHIYPVARIGTTAYGSIEKALSVVNNGTVYVLPGANPTIRENCTVPSGSKLTLHMDDNDAKYGDDAKSNDHRDYDYRQATGTIKQIADMNESKYLKNLVYISAGKKLTVNGYLNVGGYVGNGYAGGIQGQTSTAYSQIMLYDNAIIESNNEIDCLGFIKESADGNGSQVILNSGNAYAPFVIYDYAGGRSTIATYKNAEHQFVPFNVFDMPNITAKIVCHKNANLYGYADLYTNAVSINVVITTYNIPAQHNLSLVKVVGASEAVIITTGKVELKYNRDSAYNVTQYGMYNLGSTIDISCYGGGELGVMQLDVKVAIIEETVKTNTVLFPVCWKYQVSLNDGSYAIEYPTKFMSGSSLTVNSGASLSVTNQLIIYPESTRTKLANDDDNNTDADYKVFYDSVKDTECAYPIKPAAKMIVNGEVNVTGSIGGYIETEQSGAILSISGTSTYVESWEGNGFIDNSGLIKLLDSGAKAGDLYQDSAGNAAFPDVVKLSTTGNLVSSGDNSSLSANFYESNGSAWSVITNPQTYTVNLHYDNSYGDTTPNRSYRVLLRDVTSVAEKDLVVADPPELKHYEFGGWYTDSACTSPLANSTKTVANGGSVTLYAKWTPVQYTIEFMLSTDGGNSYETMNEQYAPIEFTVENGKFKVGSTSSEILTFNTAGFGDYTLFGWYKSVIDTTTAISSLTVSDFESMGGSKVVTLYGLLQKVYTITLNVGNAPSNANAKFDPIIVPQGMSIADSGKVLPDASSMSSQNSAPNISKYFDGEWYYDSAYTQPVDLTKAIESDTTLYAKWKNKTSVTYKMKKNDGTAVAAVDEVEYYMPDQTVTVDSKYGTNYNTYEAYSTASDVENGKKEEYKFSSYDKTGSFVAGTTNHTITANYTSSAIYWLVNNISATRSTITVKTGNTEVKKGEYILDGTKVTITATASNDNITAFSINGESYHNGNQKTYTVSDFEVTRPLSVSATGNNSICIVEGTLITLADGTKKAIEDIAIGEELLVFNHETGKVESSYLIVIDHMNESAGLTRVLNLEFENGNILRLSGDHGLFDMTLREYIFINSENCEDYIGHEFYSGDFVNGEYVGETTKLIRAFVTEEIVRAYSPSTAIHQNVFASNMLTVLPLPDGILGHVNFFEYDENMKYDEEKMQEDIEKYGVFTYEELSDYITYEMYLYTPFKYTKISIAKGLMTWEELLYVIEFMKNKSMM